MTDICACYDVTTLGVEEIWGYQVHRATIRNLRAHQRGGGYLFG